MTRLAKHSIEIRSALILASMVMSLGARTLFAVVPTSTPLPADASAQQILDQAGVSGGLIVHLGCGNGEFTTQLRSGQPFLVFGLDRKLENIQAARRYVRSQGLDDKVLIDRFDGAQVPCIDNLVNLLVVTQRAEVPVAEMTRVLCPRGVALIKDGDGWKKIVKPWPDDIDEWTHYLHGPDNNAVAADSQVAAPLHLQWIDGPRWARHHNHLSSTSAMVSAAGRTFAIVDEGPAASLARPAEWRLVARDAFNGVVQWKHPIGPWESVMRPFRSGPVDLARRLVAVGDRVYVTPGYDRPVIALDAATGAVIARFAETEGAVEFILDGNRLFVVVGELDLQGFAASQRRGLPSPPIGNKRLIAIDTQSGVVLWEKADGATTQLLPATLCANDGRVFFHSPRELVCLDADSGDENWRAVRPLQISRLSWSSPTVVVKEGVVLSADRAAEKTASADGIPENIHWKVTAGTGKASSLVGELIAYSAHSGDELWRCPTAMGYNSPPDVLISGGLVWTGSSPKRTTEDFTEGRDLNTGEVKRRFVTDSVFSVAHHHRCYRNKATDQFIVLGRTGVELIDLAEGKLVRDCWVRGACQYGVMPANGLLYSPPHSCACYIQSKMSGFVALASKRMPMSGVMGSEEQRLERGSAYAPAQQASSGGPGASAEPSAATWPTLRHDSARTGRSAAAIGASLKLAWQTDLGGRLTSPVVSDGTLLVSAIDTHSIHALDVASGRRLWQRIVGGAVDSPPTIASGLAVFGCADGSVYGLRMSDGELAWRFRAAPHDRRTVAFGRVESLWPVTGSVLVRNGVVYCTAGRSSFLDGGMYLYRIDLRTGQVLGKTRFNDRDPNTGRQREETITDVELPGALPDVLVDDGRYLYLRDKVLDYNGVEQDTFVPHLYSSAGLLDDTWWHRTSWLWGERNWGRASGWSVMPGIRPSGRIFVTDDSTVLGYGRKRVNGNTLAGYHLFRADKAVVEIDRKIKNNNAALAAVQRPARVKVHWSREIPHVARAMALAGRMLFAAGPIMKPGDLEPAFDDDSPATLAAYRADDGQTLASIEIQSQPVFDGIALAYDELFMATVNGKIACYRGEQ